MTTVLDDTVLAGLPVGVHATVLTDRDPNNQQVERIIVWADPVGDCPRCGQPAPERGVPVHLNGRAVAGGELVAYDLKHGCGEWINQMWVEADDAQDVPVKAAELARERRDEIATETARIRRGLVMDLATALERLADGDDPDDITTGSETIPGVFKSADGWIAWGEGPDGTEQITVYPSDVQTAEGGGV